MVDPMRFHQERIIIDGLNASWFFNDEVFARLRQGGVTAVNTTIAAWHGPAETMDMIGQMYGKLEKHVETVMQVRSVADIRRAKAENKVGCILGMQDT